MERIFVQIASYRDTECQWTIKDLFEKSAFPERISVGICWQYDPELDAACFAGTPQSDTVRALAFHWKESRGVCWARHEAQRLWNGEDYVLSIDSHMRFTQNWDDLLIKELALCPSPKSILSSHPGSYTPTDGIHAKAMPTIMYAKPFGAEGEMRISSCMLTKKPELPLRGAFVAPGYVFGRSSIISEVPYDPYLYFNQEELAMSARYFTHGYDVYSPSDVYLYHYYADAAGPHSSHRYHWNDAADWKVYHAMAARRLNHLVGFQETLDPLVTRELSRYGLGSERSLADFEAFSGIDCKKQLVSERAQKALFIENLNDYLEVRPAVIADRAHVITFPDHVLAPAPSLFSPSICSPFAQILKDVPEGVLVIENYLSAERCSEIKAFADKQSFEALKVEDKGKSWLDPARITQHVAIDPMAFEILSIFNDIYCQRVANFYNVNFEFYERPQLLRYPPGGKYNEHSDADNWRPEENAWQRNVDRDYSVILYLNDEFEGGDIRLVQQNFTLRPKPGLLLAFPSDHRFTHAVLPTTSGVRYAIVSWAAIVNSPRVRPAAPYASIWLRQKRDAQLVG